jgi:hypothetical protein
MMLPMDEDELFTMPLPPPPPGGHLPHPPHPPHHDVVFFRRGAGPGGEREHEDIMLRKVPNDVARRFRAAAGGRALTHAQYLAALVELHELARTRADAGDGDLAAALERLGLQTVTV